jgi:hypothetical protein
MAKAAKTNFFYKIKSSRWGEVIYRVLTGVLGALLVVLFLCGFMPMVSTVRYLPWIVGFSGMVSGYALTENSRGRFRHRRSVAVGAGFVMAIGVGVALNLLTGYMAGVGLIYWADMLFFACIGAICSGLGAILSIQYAKISK